MYNIEKKLNMIFEPYGAKKLTEKESNYLTRITNKEAQELYTKGDTLNALMLLIEAKERLAFLGGNTSSIESKLNYLTNTNSKKRDSEANQLFSQY